MSTTVDSVAVELSLELRPLATFKHLTVLPV